MATVRAVHFGSSPRNILPILSWQIISSISRSARPLAAHKPRTSRAKNVPMKMPMITPCQNIGFASFVQTLNTALNILLLHHPHDEAIPVLFTQVKADRVHLKLLSSQHSGARTSEWDENLGIGESKG